MNKLILITGGSASGKSHLASELAKYLGKQAIVISQDSFYKPNGTTKWNYDKPSAFDFKKQRQTIKSLIANQEAQLAVYDFSINDVVGLEKIKPAKYIILEGLFTFFDKEFAKKADFRIYVDTPIDTSLSRRIIRDVKTRGRDINEIINRWLKDVKPAYMKYILPMQEFADIVIPWHKLNKRSIQAIIATIKHLDLGIKDIF